MKKKQHLFFVAFEVDSQEQCNKHDQHAKYRLCSQQMPVHQARKKNADGLPGGHDEREYYGTKLRYGIKYEKLTDC